jgi:hypothetical protein
MPLCGFNTKMVQGIALFSEGLFEATLDRAEAQGVDIEQAFRTELKEITAFLEAIEKMHQETKRDSDRATTMTRIVRWMAENDR